MVWARTKLVLHDNCFREEPGKLIIKYVGPNPGKIYKKLYELMKTIFKVKDSDIQETKYNWGVGEKQKFDVGFFLHKDLDKFSFIVLEVKLRGAGNEKGGEATIELDPYLRTEYPQETVWERSLFYEMLRTFWHKVFYRDTREKYLEECRHLVTFLQEKLREFLNQLREAHE